MQHERCGGVRRASTSYTNLLRERFALLKLTGPNMPRIKLKKVQIQTPRGQHCDRCGKLIYEERCVFLKHVGFIHPGCD